MSAELVKSKFVRRTSSVVRPSVFRLWHQFSLKLLHGLLSNSSCGFPWAICPNVFFFLKKKNFCDLLGIFFWLWCRNLIVIWILSNIFWNFFSVVLTKVLFWIFEILSFWFFRILFVFVNMGPYGSQNFKMLLLPQITFESFQTFSEFSSQRSS